MNCQELREQLHPYMDGELEPARVSAVERALQDCPDCQAELEELQAVQLMARAAFMGPAAEADLSGVFDGVMQTLRAEGALREEASDQREAAQPGLWDYLKSLLTFEQPMMSMVAAAAAIGLALGAWWLSGGAQTPQSAPTIATSPDVADAPNESVASTTPVTKPIGKRRGPETESGRHAAFVEHIEASKGRVVVDANTDDPSKPMVVWHHVDGDGATPAGEFEGTGAGQEL